MLRLLAAVAAVLAASATAASAGDAKGEWAREPTIWDVRGCLPASVGVFFVERRRRRSRCHVRDVLALTSCRRALVYPKRINR
jgi:hypothetical protein